MDKYMLGGLALVVLFVATKKPAPPKVPKTDNVQNPLAIFGAATGAIKDGSGVVKQIGDFMSNLNGLISNRPSTPRGDTSGEADTTNVTAPAETNAESTDYSQFATYN